MSSSKPDIANDDPEEVEELPDDDSAQQALQSVLEEMSSVYHVDGERIQVALKNHTSAAVSDDQVIVNKGLPDQMDPPVTGPNILRLLDDLLAHEVSHVNWSDLDSKRRFADCYPGWGKIPGFVANVLEDEYVDAKRREKWYGMREKFAYYVWLHMNTEERAPRVDEVEAEEGYTQALVSAFFQTALAGYARGLDEASDEIAQFCAEVEPVVRRVRGEDNPRQRFMLFHAVMQVLIRYAPEPDDIDEDKLSKRRRESGAGEGGGAESISAPKTADGEPKVEMDDETEEAVEELLEELTDEEEIPSIDPATPDTVPEAESEEDDDESEGPESEIDDESDGGVGDDADESADGEPAEAGDGSTSDSDSDIDGLRDLLSDYDPRNLKVVN